MRYGDPRADAATETWCAHGIAKRFSDVLAMNKLGEALYSEMLANPRRPVNSVRFCFLDPPATTFLVDWDESADASVGVLRAEAGRDPHTTRTSRPDLVLFAFTAEVRSKSEEALNLLASWTTTPHAHPADARGRS